MAHYLNFFMESAEIAEAKVAVVDKRATRAEKELCKAEAQASKAK